MCMHVYACVLHAVVHVCACIYACVYAYMHLYMLYICVFDLLNIKYCLYLTLCKIIKEIP